LPWTDEPVPTPQRSETELYADVQRRASTIRRRRRAGVSAGLGSVVAVLLVAFALARTGDDRASQLRVVGGGDTTTTSVAPAPTTAFLPSTTLPVAATTTTRPAAAVTSTTRTSLRPTTTKAPTTTSSTIPAPLRQCGPGEAVVTARPDQPSYPASTASLMVHVSAQNRSSTACQPLDPAVEFRNPAGAVMFTVGLADVFTFGMPGQPQPSWDPGETLSTTMGAPFFTCNEAPCPPGTYSATAIFGPYRSPPAPFAIT
jgi:hypothetical protein